VKRIGNKAAYVFSFLAKKHVIANSHQRHSCIAIISIHEHQRWASAILVRTSATLQYCAQTNRLRSCGLKKVAELRLQAFKIDFRNSVTLCSLLPIPLLSSAFYSAQDDLKIQPKIFLELSVARENRNLP
jgi:hypothetical protein